MAPLILLMAMDVTVRLHWLSGGPRAETIRLPLEDYVAGVLGGEAAGVKSSEARRAIAVAARTYAVHHRGRHAKEGFDFCDTTHCQDLRLGAVNELLQGDANATEGELLWRDGLPIEALYSRNCGRDDGWCPRDEWQRRLTRAEAGAASIRVARREAGRVAALLLDGRPVDGEAFRLDLGRRLGWDRLPSPRYEVIEAGDAFVFRGRGHGHGLGLCQEGAANMGQRGKSRREILEHYYPGAKVGLTASGISWQFAGGERVDVFGTPADGEVVVLADVALRRAETLTGWRLATRPKLRVYPTVASFRNSTSAGASAAAVTHGATVRLQPVSILRARGLLTSTVEHEMLHVVLESHSAPRQPWWFREGLVLALGDERPTDAAYGDAASRVRRLMTRHGRATVLGWWQRGLPRDIDPGEIHQRPTQGQSRRQAEQLHR